MLKLGLRPSFILNDKSALLLDLNVGPLDRYQLVLALVPWCVPVLETLGFADHDKNKPYDFKLPKDLLA